MGTVISNVSEQLNLSPNFHVVYLLLLQWIIQGRDSRVLLRKRYLMIHCDSLEMSFKNNPCQSAGSTPTDLLESHSRTKL